MKSKLEEWVSLWDSTLDELLRHNGLLQSTCQQCSNTPMENYFRCIDCSHRMAVYCKDYILATHLEKVSLASLGLCVQLGYDGAPCPHPAQGPSHFIVFDMSGAYQVCIDYCDYQEDNISQQRIQLLQKQWFPATLSQPQTAFTFDCLDTFHESSLQGKGNLFGFYHMLLHKTDNANISRSGHGHDPKGVGSTSVGELVVECPAFPQIGCNIPDNWHDSGPLLYI
ncbi:hypothetical protein BDQ17DRAFT_1395298 [Cyathus striatus]|nr:hypothetical protein BDQ17DRAFT_1395298 [Cyathus striatus]